MREAMPAGGCTRGLEPMLESVRVANYIKTIRRDLLKVAEAPRGGRARRWLALAGVVVALALILVRLPDDRSDGEAAPGPPAPLTAQGVESDLPAPPTTLSTTTTGPPPTPPGFESSIHEIDGAAAARLHASWRPGCPVPRQDLRLVKVTHWDFDDRARPGELVVRATHAEGIRRVFADLFAAHFPIEQVRLVDEFGGDDDRSMAANNTSAFNCRRVKGSTSWSQHAYGQAIDINPVQNPYVTRSGVSPPAGRDFLRRDGTRQGLITARSPVVAAFARNGWRWGGTWSSPDYQHFSTTGR